MSFKEFLDAAPDDLEIIQLPRYLEELREAGMTGVEGNLYNDRIRSTFDQPTATGMRASHHVAADANAHTHGADCAGGSYGTTTYGYPGPLHTRANSHADGDPDSGHLCDPVRR